MSKPLPWIILSILLGSGLLIQTISKQQGALKTAYVTNAQLYAEFQLSKELDAQIKAVQLARQATLDSLSLPLDALEQKIIAKTASEQDIQVFNRMSQAFNLKQQQFAEDNALMVQRSQEQIATQLNQYLEDFTKEQGYDYIFGATGAGSLMGAKEAYNVTDEVLRYANERYKGGGQ